MSGTIWMYSDRMDDWDIMFAQKSFITYREGCDYYDLTEKVMIRLAQEAGAVYKMGTRFVRIRRDVFEEYLREQYRKEISCAFTSEIFRVFVDKFQKTSDIIFISSNGAGFQISKLANIFDFIHI